MKCWLAASEFAFWHHASYAYALDINQAVILRHSILLLEQQGSLLIKSLYHPPFRHLAFEYIITQSFGTISFTWIDQYIYGNKHTPTAIPHMHTPFKSCTLYIRVPGTCGVS